MNGITQIGISVLPVSIVCLAIAVYNLFIIIKYISWDYKNAFMEA